MKKRNLSVLLLALMLIGCGQTSNSQDNSVSSLTSPSTSISTQPVIEMPDVAREFVDMVNSLRLDSDFSYFVNEAFDLYEQIDDATWATFPEVQEAYYKLVQLEEVYYEYAKVSNMANDFIAKVDAIPYFLTLNDERYIIAAETAYESLGDGVNIIGVSEAYAKLLRLRKQFDDLYAASIIEELEKEIESFLDLVNKLPTSELLSLSDKADLDIANNSYESLSVKAKDDERVIESKVKLDELNARYDVLLEHPEYGDEAIINRFILEVNNINDVTIDDSAKLLKAKEDYQMLTDISKNLDNVQEAYNKLETLFNDFFKLYIEVNGSKEDEQENSEEENIVAFVNLVNAIPSVDNITQSDANSIVEAEKCYDNLTVKAKNDVRSLEAYEVLKEARAKLNTFLETALPFEANLLFSGDILPHIVLQIQVPYSEIKAVFGVTDASQLKDKVAMYLYVYTSVSSNEPIAKINVSNSLYSNSNLINGSSIAASLEELSAYNKDLVSNKFSFGLQFEDRTGQYKESVIKRSNLSPRVYTFENIYKDEEENDTILIHNKDELLAIKNNLSGNYKLANDIDLAGIEWVNLGVFLGTLDGNGYAIKNITCSQGEDAQFGLFLEVKANAVVKDLILEGKVEGAGAWAGAIAVRNYGLISDCLVNLNISSNGNVGGVVCENHSGGRIENCIVLSTINGSDMDGGIAVGQYGSVSNTYFIVDNVSNGKAVGNSDALSETGKTIQEIKSVALYNAFDNRLWLVVDGYYPTLVRY